MHGLLLSSPSSHQSAFIVIIKTVLGSSLLIYPLGFLFADGLLNCFSQVVPRCVSRWHGGGAPQVLLTISGKEEDHGDTGDGTVL